MIYLNEKQIKFVKYYCDSKNKDTYNNATQSAMRAYGSKYKAAAVTGSRLLRNPKVIRAIEIEDIKRKNLNLGTKRKLTLKEQVFVKSITDKTSDTYGKIGKSAKKAYEIDKMHTAYAVGREIASKPIVQSAIEEELEKQGIGIPFRLQVLKNILSGNHTSTAKIKRVYRDKEGNVTSVVTETRKQQASSKDILSANNLLNKMTGLYDKNRVKADLTGKELQRLFKEQRKYLNEKGKKSE